MKRKKCSKQQKRVYCEELSCAQLAPCSIHIAQKKKRRKIRKRDPIAKALRDIQVLIDAYNQAHKKKNMFSDPQH